MSHRVLLLGVAPPVLDALARRGLRAVPVQGSEELLAGLADASVVVVAGITPGLAVAQDVGRRDHRLPVLVLEEPDGLATARSRVQTAPFVGRDARVLDASEPAERIAAEVEAEAERHARWDQHSTRVARIAAHELPLALAGGATASQYLGQLVEHAPIGVITVDPEGAIRGWNPKTGELTGRAGRDAVGTPLDALFVDEDRASLRALLERARTSAGSHQGTFARRGPQGDDQHLELIAASLDQGLGGLGVLVLVQDVTARLRDATSLAARAREAMLAAAVGAAVTGPQPLAEKLGACTDAVVSHIGAAFARIWILEPGSDELVLRASSGLYTHLDGGHARVPVGSFKIGRIAARRRPHLTNSVLDDPEISDPGWARHERMVAFAGYPLIAADQLWGVLALFARHELPEGTLRSLGAVADTIAVGIQQGRSEEQIHQLLEAEQAARRAAEEASHRYASLAQTLQQSLLPPRLPQIPDLDVAARYRWAGDGDEIGGDFYDLLLLPDGRWCAVLGDISGKGVGAARTTALVRYTLRTAARSEADLPTLVSTLNEAMLEDRTADRYCTLVLAAGEPGRSLQVTLLLAGHPYPLVLGPDGDIREVGSPNVPVGMFPGAVYETSTATVPVGSTLLLFSDGVTDVRRPDGTFHHELLAEVLRGAAGLDPEGIAAQVEAAAVAHQGGRPHDDIAIMAMSARPPAAGGGVTRPA